MKTLNLFVLLFLAFSMPNLWADGDEGGADREVTRSDLPEYAFGPGTETAGNADDNGPVPETLSPTALELRREAEREEVPVRRVVEEERPVPEREIPGSDEGGDEAGGDEAGGDGTVVLSGQEVTPEELARREEEARLRAEEERRAAEARAAAERIAERRREEEASGNTCERDKQNLINHQKNIFGLQSPQGNKLLDLLKRQDDLKARITTYQTLLDIWKGYQGFLTSNDNLVAGSLQSPASAQDALNKLDELQSFIGNNQQPVERYQIAAEVLNALPSRQDLRQLPNDEAKFEYIVSAMESRCQELGANASALHICGINIRESVTLEPQINRNPTNRAQLINKFVNTAINIDGADYVFNLNFSSLFVDDERHTNLTGQPEFAMTMQKVIQKSKDYCRHQVLLEDSEDITCLKAPLSEVLGAELGDAQEKVINRLQALNGGTINNVSDLTNSYLQMAKRTKDFHEEMTGGTINQLGDMAANIENLQAQFDSAEAALTNPATVRALRTQFKNLTKEKVLNLGRSLNHNEFQRNHDLFKKYTEGHPNLLDGPGRLDMEKGESNKAQFANRLVQEILCRGNTGSCPVSGGIFTQNGDDLVLDQNNIIEIFNNMMDSAGGPDALKDILGEEQEQGLKDELARVQSEIAAIKTGGDYRSLNAFKNFIWEQAKESCMQGQEDNVVVHQGATCVMTGNIQSGLNDFLQIGGDLVAYQNREDARVTVSQLHQTCVSLHDQDFPRYQRDYVDTGICPAVFQERQRIDRENITRAENVRRGPTTHDPNIIYEYDRNGRVVGRHVPSSNLAIFLPQAAYTVNEQLPFYFVQRPGMNMAIENWRQMGIQQKTANAYWEAQRQSWLNNTTCGPFGCYYNSTMLEGVSPTFGNFGFSFGSTTTIPTTFNTGVNTIPSTNSTGFGF